MAPAEAWAGAAPRNLGHDRGQVRSGL